MDKDLHLKICLRSLVPLGTWPLEFPIRKIWRYVYFVYSKIITYYFVIFVATQYVNIAQNLGESFLNIVDNLSVSLLYTETIVKGFVIRGNGTARIVKQIRDVEKFIMQGDDERVKSIYLRHVKWNTRVSVGFITIVTITTLPFYINPLILLYSMDSSANATVDLPLPFGSWFPFDKNYYYGWSFTLQVIAGTYGGYLTGNTDSLYWALMIFGIGQIKVLQYKLENISEHARILVSKGHLNREEAIQLCLKKGVLLHQLIIRYIADINNIMKWLMLVDFIICSLLISVVGFQIIVSGFGFAQLTTLEYLMAILVQMFLFYWHANEIILESMDVAKAIWNGDFYEYPLPIQKSLALVTHRAQQPLNLNVGPFYTMSTETALAIIRAGYSYVTIMRQMYS